MLKELAPSLSTFYNRKIPSNPKTQKKLLLIPMNQNTISCNNIQNNYIKNDTYYQPDYNNYNNFPFPNSNYYPNIIGQTVNKRPKSAGKIYPNVSYNPLLNNNNPKYILIPNNSYNNFPILKNKRSYFYSDNDNDIYSQNNPLNFSTNNIIRKTYSSSLYNNLNKSKDFLDNNSMSNLEEALHRIHVNGFQKYENEIENKKIKIFELQTSIALLNKKINICNKNLYQGLQKETKNKIKYDNLLTVSKKYKNNGNKAQNLRKEIERFQQQIFELNNNTSWLRGVYLSEQNSIDYLVEETRNLNKVISDLKKDNEQFLPAIELLKKHIKALEKKLEYSNDDKNNIATSFNRFAKNI